VPNTHVGVRTSEDEWSHPRWPQLVSKRSEGRSRSRPRRRRDRLRATHGHGYGPRENERESGWFLIYGPFRPEYCR
jgi:hypothetical protein